MKDSKTIKVDKDFLMKITKKVDDLSAQVKTLSTQKEEVKQDKSRFQFSVTFQVTNLEDSGKLQKSFIDDLKLLMLRYPLKKLSVDYKK